MLGIFSDYTPRFVKQYVNLSMDIRRAFEQYRDEVREGAFPTLDHCFIVRETGE